MQPNTSFGDHSPVPQVKMLLVADFFIGRTVQVQAVRDAMNFRVGFTGLHIYSLHFLKVLHMVEFLRL